ncbi:DinB family protein [Hymenobacter rigui]|uniref:DinB family protein n=1 Tax=Hymenobacter rigui TaxID=334424 RepID=A0A428KVU1_9BACT|nr:DinB family protein [Hymenobacter rigui]RSK50940.1 DinB family protein [Hymenobacter rigui]
MHQVCRRLQELLNLLNEELPALSVEELTVPTAPGRWSRQEVLGHLIDSAANNHRRFVLALTRPEPLVIVPYDQEDWVRCADYQHTPAANLLALWTTYNQQLMRLISRIPAEAHQYRCEFENGYSVTLGWLIEDYAVHMEHHVQQILDRTPR